MDNVRQFSSDKILKHLDRVCEWLDDKNTCPITVELDMTNLCNHRCPGCVSNYFRTSDNNSLSLETAEKIVWEIFSNGIKGLIFTGGGEPLCNPHTLEIIPLVKKLNIDIGFITNGSLIDTHSAKIILKNCTWVRVSLDAGSPEVFKVMHGVDYFNKIVKGIKLLTDIKKKTKSKCTVGVGFLTSDDSVGDMENATKLSKKLGVDYLQFRPMQIHQGGEFGYYWTNINKEIDKCLKYSDDKFHVLYSQHKYEMVNDPCFGRNYGKCYGQQFATVVSATGKMYICCHLRGYEKYCIGDLTKNTFEEVWNSEQRKKAVDSIDFKDCIPLCRDNTFNQILWNIKQPREHVNFL